MDTKTRSWVKSITWRIAGIVLLGAITWLVTKDWKEMTIITVLFHGIRLILYYVHERLWERVSWGRVLHPLATLPVKGKLTPEDLDQVREKLRELGYIE